MTTLADRLRAAIDETERIAHACGGEGWSAAEPAHGMRRVSVDYSIETVVACTLAVRGVHIARHDPAAVLRRCAADRKILDLHAPTEYRMIRGGVTHVILQCNHCAGLCHSGSGLSCDEPCDAVYPCETVTLLAEAYGVEA